MTTSLLVLALASAVQDTSRFGRVDSLIEAAIGERAFPGAVVAIGSRDSVLYLRAFGRHTYDRSPAVTTRTVYDVASLTKVVGLTTAVMMLVDEGRLPLDTTLRDLLAHRSGLPAWRPFYQRVRNRDEMFALAAEEPLENPPRSRMVYSDIGAIRITAMVEAASGQRLDRLLASRLFQPLGMRDTRYNPPRSWRGRIAPTEIDTIWRHRLVHGQVHDENAASMGGISGHAGLFSTVPDFARFAQWMLRCSGAPAHERTSVLVSCETVRMFTQRQDSAFSSRALGWDTPDGQNSAGTRLSDRAFGHTGFTGTSLWIDPEADLFVILFTNRVYPTRENRRIFAVRRALADAAVEMRRGR